MSSSTPTSRSSIRCFSSNTDDERNTMVKARVQRGFADAYVRDRPWLHSEGVLARLDQLAGVRTRAQLRPATASLRVARAQPRPGGPPHFPIRQAGTSLDNGSAWQCPGAPQLQHRA
jgi:hypothetical protein